MLVQDDFMDVRGVFDEDHHIGPRRLSDGGRQTDISNRHSAELAYGRMALASDIRARTHLRLAAGPYIWAIAVTSMLKSDAVSRVRPRGDHQPRKAMKST